MYNMLDMNTCQTRLKCWKDQGENIFKRNLDKSNRIICTVLRHDIQLNCELQKHMKLLIKSKVSNQIW